MIERSYPKGTNVKREQSEISAYESVRQAIEHWKRGDLSGAHEHYEVAISKLKEIKEQRLWLIEDSDDAEGLGDLSRELGKYKEAIALYEMAWGAGHIKIGHVYYENLKDFDSAYQIYLNFIESHDFAPDCSSAALSLAEMSSRGQGTPRNQLNALVWMNIAISTKPDCVAATEAIEKLKAEVAKQDVERAVLLAEEWLKNRNEAIAKRWKENPWSRVGV